MTIAELSQVVRNAAILTNRDAMWANRAPKAAERIVMRIIERDARSAARGMSQGVSNAISASDELSTRTRATLLSSITGLERIGAHAHGVRTGTSLTSMPDVADLLAIESAQLRQLHAELAGRAHVDAPFAVRATRKATIRPLAVMSARDANTTTRILLTDPSYTGIQPHHLVRESDVDEFLRGSVISVPTNHGVTSDDNYASVLLNGAVVGRNKRSRFGRAFYTSEHAAGNWGPQNHRIAVRSTSPLRVDSHDEFVRWYRNNGGSPRGFDHDHVRQTILGNGHDAILYSNPGSNDGFWLLGLTDDSMRVVIPDDVASALYDRVGVVNAHTNQLLLPLA